MARSTRRTACAALFWASLSWGGAAQAQVPAAAPLLAASDTSAEPVVVDIRFAKIAAATVQAFRQGDEVLLPLSAFFDLAEIKHEAVKAGRLTAMLQPGDKSFVADAKQGVASAGAIRATPGRAALREEGEEIYLSSAVLGRLLGISFRIDWAELSANVDEPGALPIVARLARVGERAAHLRATEEAGVRFSVDATRGLSRPLLDGAVLDYSLSLPSQQPLEKGSYGLQFGADLLGGSLETNLTSTGGLKQLGVRGLTTWTGVWRESPFVKQAKVGSTITTGLAPQVISGATITNAPYVRSATFGTLEFPGQVGPRWEVEVYRDGLLVAVDSTDSRGRFRVPLEVRYGTNLVKFIAYGPNGEERTFTGSFLLVDNLVPYHHFEYAASAGRCTSTSCTGAANADFRYGIAKTWTVRAGVDGYTRAVGTSPVPADTSSKATLDSAMRVRDTASVMPALPVVPGMAARLSRAYASVSGNPFNALNITAGYTQHTSTNVAFQYQPSPSLNLVGSRTAYPTPISDPLLGVQGVLAEERLSAFWRPLGERNSLYVDASDVVRRSVAETQTALRTAVSFDQGGIRVSPFLVRDIHSSATSTSATNGYGVGAFIPPSPFLGTFLGRFSLRPAIESRSGHGIDQLSVGFARTFGDIRVDGNFTKASAGGAMMSMSFSTDFSRFRAGASINLSPSEKTSLQSIQGSVLYDRRAGLPHFYRGPSLGRSGVSGLVFLDENGDGVMDGSEQPLPGVTVRVGASAAQTDSLGKYSVWDIPSFEPVTVQLDTSSFANPVWTPTVSTLSVQPGPHRFEPVNFAVVVGGTVEGRVVRLVDGQPSVPIPGATVIFTERTTRAERSVDTFSDGSFNVTGIRPGVYELRVDPASMTALRGKSDSIPVTVKPSATGSVVKDAELTVRIDVPQPGS
ncbi:hypothetical protein BH11GEM1_BH11GEM1_00110 [soil metagenome]